MIRVKINIVIDAPAEFVFTIAKDVMRLSSWLPGITSAEFLAQEGDVSVIEFCGVRLHNGRLVLECVKASAERVIFAEVDRYRGRGFSGDFSVRQNVTGQGSILSVELQQDGLPFNLLRRRRLRRLLSEILATVRQQAQASFFNEVAPTNERRKVLEVFRRDKRLFVRIKDHLIELPLESVESGL